MTHGESASSALKPISAGPAATGTHAHQTKQNNRGALARAPAHHARAVEDAEEQRLHAVHDVLNDQLALVELALLVARRLVFLMGV